VSLRGRVLRVEAAYLILAAMVPLLNRHFSWGEVRLPMECYSQLLGESAHVKPIWCPLIVSEISYVDGGDFASHGIAVPVGFCSVGFCSLLFFNVCSTAFEF